MNTGGGGGMSQVVYAPLDAIHISQYEGLQIKGRHMREAVTRKTTVHGAKVGNALVAPKKRSSISGRGGERVVEFEISKNSRMHSRQRFYADVRWQRALCQRKR